MFDSSSDDDQPAKKVQAKPTQAVTRGARVPQKSTSLFASGGGNAVTTQQATAAGGALEDILGDVAKNSNSSNGGNDNRWGLGSGKTSLGGSGALTNETSKFAANIAKQHAMRTEEKQDRQIEKLQRDAVAEAKAMGEDNVDFSGGFITDAYQNVLDTRQKKPKLETTTASTSGVSVAGLVSSLAKKRSAVGGGQSSVVASSSGMDFGDDDFYDIMANKAAMIGRAPAPQEPTGAIEGSDDGPTSVEDGPMVIDEVVASGGDDDDGNNGEQGDVQPPPAMVEEVEADGSEATQQKSTLETYKQAMQELAEAKKAKRECRALSAISEGDLDKMKKDFLVRKGERQAALEAHYQKLLA